MFFMSKSAVYDLRFCFVNFFDHFNAWIRKYNFSKKKWLPVIGKTTFEDWVSIGRILIDQNKRSDFFSFFNRSKVFFINNDQ
jgi:hypothetical protein